jgi:serine protease DegQ
LRFLFLVALLAAPVLADDKPKDAKASGQVDVPYKLTETKHIHVRLKLNGKGPYNFILDTGAPAVFLTKAIAKKIGLEEDKNGWGEFKSFEIEGGLSVDKARARVADLFQLDGMNSMGLAGVELHGVIGYEMLARFRITYDMTADKLAFVPLKDFTPPALVAPTGGGKGKANSQGGLDMLGPLMKTLAGMMGVKPNFNIKSSGFLGAEFEEGKEGLLVKSILKGSPAQLGGLKVGDKLEGVKNGKTEASSKLQAAINKAAIGDTVEVTVSRDGTKKTLTVELGRGL